MACALANNGFGESLCNAAQSLSSIEFSDYLFEWRKGVRSFLRTDPVRSMGARHPALASSMSDSFPNPDIINLYLSPLTSSKEDISNLHLDGGLPDVVRITQLCELYFSWGAPDAILSKFENGVFHALLMAALRDEIGKQEAQGIQTAASPSKVCT